MNTAPVVDTMLRQLDAVACRLPFPRVRRLHLPPWQPRDGRQDCPAGFCALELEDGAFGLTLVLLRDAHARMLSRHAADSGCGRLPLAGASARKIATGLASQDAVDRALGLAAINALTHSAWLRLGYQPPPAGNSLGGLALLPGDRVGMVGAFNPLLGDVQRSGAELTVVELDPDQVRALQAGHPWLHATLDRSRLAKCNKIIASATMLHTDTLQAVLDACSAAAEFAVIGPSAGFWPDPLFARGVTHLAGTLVVDGAALADAVANGQPLAGATRKFNIARTNWPGWRALLQGQ